MASKSAPSSSSDSEPGDPTGLIRPESAISPAGAAPCGTSVPPAAAAAASPPRTTDAATLAPRTAAGARFSADVAGETVPTPSLHVRRAGSALGGRVLVLNASYEPINVCTVRRAIVLILKQKAEVLDEHDIDIHSERSTMTRPSVIRLRAYVRIPYQSLQRKITRRAVFARDAWECQYCGRKGSLTMDHVIPRSRGGDTSWENVVTCCASCNRRKGDRSVSQAGMKLRTHPRPPHATIFIHVASPTIPPQWLPYVPAVPATDACVPAVAADAA